MTFTIITDIALMFGSDITISTPYMVRYNIVKLI